MAKRSKGKKQPERPREQQTDDKKPADLKPPKDKAGDVRGGPLMKR